MWRHIDQSRLSDGITPVNLWRGCETIQKKVALPIGANSR
jgi:hypothetical protein